MTAIHSFYIINKTGGLIFYKVNIHLLRMIPFDEDNIVLGHQVLCLAMLFDFFFDDGNMSSERRSTSVIDVGLCKPMKPLEEYYMHQKKLLNFQVAAVPGDSWKGLLAALQLQNMTSASHLLYKLSPNSHQD